MSENPDFSIYGQFERWDSENAREVNAQMVEWAGAAALIGHYPESRYFGGGTHGYDIEVAGLGKVEIKTAKRLAAQPELLNHSPLSDKQLSVSSYCALVVIANDATIGEQTCAPDGLMSVSLQAKVSEIFMVPIGVMKEYSEKQHNAGSVIPLAQLSGFTLAEVVARTNATSQPMKD